MRIFEFFLQFFRIIEELGQIFWQSAFNRF